MNPWPCPPRSLLSRLFAGLLFLLPQWFRRRYGEEMRATFEGQLAAARARGRLSAAAYGTRALVQVPGVALRLRLARRRREPGEPPAVVDGLRYDLRHAVHSLARTPGTSLASLLILVLAIGGTTAVFGVLNAVLLEPLPYADPQRLMTLWTVNTQQNLPDGTSYPNFADWREHGTSFEDLTLYFRPEFTNATLSGFDRPERVHVGLVAPNFFDVLGVSAIRGRTFSGADLAGQDETGLAVVSEGFWNRRFAGAPDMDGQTLTLDGTPCRIVGVLPESVDVPYARTQVWRLYDPRSADRTSPRARRDDTFVVLARLRPGVTQQQAQAEMDRIAQDLARRYPDSNANLAVRVRSLLHEITGEALPRTLWLIFAAVLLVQLVATTSVAHLLVTRGIRRQREYAIRATLGASRLRLSRQLLVEYSMLAGFAAVAGIACGQAALRLALRWIDPDVPRLAQVGLDHRVLGMALLLALLAGPVFGLIPALATSGQDPARALRGGGRGASAKHGVRHALVLSQVTLAVVLLVLAGLLTRSAWAIHGIPPGYAADSVLLARVVLGMGEYGEEARREAFDREVRRSLENLPGVLGVSTISNFFVERIPDTRLQVVGQPPVDPTQPFPRLIVDQIAPGFFEALGQPILEGRGFEAADVLEGAPLVALINRTAAETFWPGRSPVGERFRWSSRSDDPEYTVVGVVPDMRRESLEIAPFPNVFVPGFGWRCDFVVRANGDPLALAGAVSAAVREADPGVPVESFTSAAFHYDEALGQRHAQVVLLVAFAGLAVLLVAIGLYALLHETVWSRRREIGIRIALGAAPGRVRRLVWRQALGPIAGGLVLGLVVAVAAGRFLASMLYGVRGDDPWTLVGVGSVLLVVSLVAGWLPARRAAQLPPSETLAGD